MEISCIVIDANQQSVCMLEESIKQFNQIDLVASFDNPLLAIDFLMEHKIHFVFMAPEFKNAFDHQVISKLENKPLLTITDTNSESEIGSLFSNNASYVLNPLAYADFFQTITSLRQSNAESNN